MGRMAFQDELLRLVILEKEMETRMGELSVEAEKAKLSEELSWVRLEQEKLKQKIYQDSIERFNRPEAPLQELLTRLTGKTPEQIQTEKRFEEIEIQEELSRLQKETGKTPRSAKTLPR